MIVRYNGNFLIKFFFDTAIFFSENVKESLLQIFYTDCDIYLRLKVATARRTDVQAHTRTENCKCKFP